MNEFKLTKAFHGHCAPYGKVVMTFTERFLHYAERTIKITRYSTGYHTSHCHYTGSCGANHSTLRTAIQCAKSRTDAGLTWNS